MVLQPILTMKRRMTKNSMECVKKFIRKNTVMCIAFIAAVITSFIIPIDNQYADYFDYKTGQSLILCKPQI